MQRAVDLAKDPDLLRPRCIGSCRRCHFDKSFKKIKAMAPYIDNSEKLAKAASRGSDALVKAYAGTVSLAAAGKIPYLATAKMPSGDISFAVRGKVKHDKLIGVQYFDDPDMSLLAYTDVSKKRKLRMYSMEDGVLCCDRSGFPDEYIEERLASSPYTLDENGACPHESSRGHLVLSFNDDQRKIKICRSCAGDRNIMHHMISRMTSPGPMKDIEVHVVHSFHDMDDPSLSDFRIDDDHREAYNSGKLSDRKLIDEVIKRRSNEMKSSGSAVLMIGDRNYGRDMDTFLHDLRGSDEEKDILQRFLEKEFVAVLVKGDRVSEAINQLWPEHHDALILAASSPEVLDEMGDVSVKNPNKAVSEAVMRQQAKGILADIPVFSDLGEVGGYADHLARVFKVGGAAAVKRSVESETRSYRNRAVGLAFLRAVGETSNTWQYNKEEVEFSTYLEQFAKAMMDDKGDAYRDSLANMIVASGSGEQPPQP